MRHDTPCTRVGTQAARRRVPPNGPVGRNILIKMQREVKKYEDVHASPMLVCQSVRALHCSRATQGRIALHLVP